jgi:hypothetical protein
MKRRIFKMAEPYNALVCSDVVLLQVYAQNRQANLQKFKKAIVIGLLLDRFCLENGFSIICV